LLRASFKAAYTSSLRPHTQKKVDALSRKLAAAERKGHRQEEQLLAGERSIGALRTQLAAAAAAAGNHYFLLLLGRSYYRELLFFF
jgi:hypothetical protein